MVELKNLTDAELLRRTGEVARRERTATLELIVHLREVDRRELYVGLGFSSLFDYCVHELKISQGSSYRRIQTMKLVEALPEAMEKLVEGSLSFTTAAKVQTATAKASVEEKRELLERVAGKSTREVDREIAKLDPKTGREWSRWLSGEEVQLCFCLDRESYKDLLELQLLRTHVDVTKTLRTLFTDLVKLGHEKWNPLRRSATTALRTPRVIPEEGWKTVPPSLREAVWKRDEGQCSYFNPENGRRCDSRELLQLDHIEPLALGGKNLPDNLRLLCAKHNRARAEETFGSV